MLSVVLYHFGVPWLHGGFAGVDVFFVISGFLIGGLLWKELEGTGTIRLGRFYMRRIRRLAPAFFLIAAVTAAASWLILLPWEFREFGKSLVAATVWLSNVQFWREAGYFDVASDLKPLLHTWSLAVEEQFYIFLPLTLLALRFSRGVLLAALVTIWAASLLLCLMLTPERQAATFFLFPFRAWELLTGVLLAIGMRDRGDPGTGRPFLSVAGLALVVASVFLVRAEGFPGWQAALPVAGTAMILANAADRTLVNRVLASPLPVFVGLISYSLYLWHWPVLVLSRYWRDGYAGPGEAAAWLGLAILLAVMFWALVERPIRRGRWLAPAPLLGASALAAVTLVAFGGLLYLRDGLPGRFEPTLRGHIAASGDFLQDTSRCTLPQDGPLAGLETCAIGPEGAPRVLVWGDSHLRALMNGLALAGIEAETPGLIVWRAGCPPLFGLSKEENSTTPAQDAACLDATAQMRAALPELGVDRVLLVGRWSYYADGTGIGRDVGNEIALAAAPGSGLSGDTQVQLYEAAWELTAEVMAAAGIDLWVLRQVPEIPDYDSRDVSRLLAHGRIAPTDVAALTAARPEELAARVMEAEHPIYRLAAEGRLHLIDPWPMLCPDRCSAMLDGRPVYFDNNHLTNTGAIAIRRLFFPALTGREG